MLSADEWREYAVEIENDGTPSQVGPSAEDCLQVAALIGAAQLAWELVALPEHEQSDYADAYASVAADFNALLPQTGEAEPEKPLPAMLRRFMAALLNKAQAAGEKYGYRDNWLHDDWEEDLRRDIRAHVEKGDPVDVALYAAFAWAREYSLAAPGGTPRSPAIDGELLRSLLAEGFHTAFRKASEHKLSSQIHSLIGDLPQREWGEVIEFVAYGLESSFAAGHNALPAPMSEVERDTLSDLEICNLALSRIAAEPISSLDENSSAARHCAELYAPTLDNLLRCGTWPYQPLLANALSWRLAADLASALRDDVTRRHEAMAEFARALLANQEARIAEKAIADALSKREDG